jgi:hypothetical protein
VFLANDAKEEPMHPEPSPVPPNRTLRWRRVLAIGAGVAMVPALYAVASAATGSGSDQPAASVRAAATTGDRGTELETEHGVVVEKPHGGAPTPSIPEVTTPTTVAPTVPTTPEQEVEHPVPEPGDDRGVDPVDGGSSGPGSGAAPAPAPAIDQSFSSVGGSITVTVANRAVSLASSSPAPGFAAEVHDNGPDRVEVRFFSGGGQEWRIRIELEGGGLTSEITQHG